jgi:hypothetical protein
LLLVCIACKPAPPKPAAKPVAGPQVRATVVTIRTTIQPGDRTYTHSLVIAGDRARFTGEVDTWRIFDAKANTITYVDDLAKTIRTEPLAALVRKRRTTLAGALPPHFPRARLAKNGTRKPILGLTAEQTVVEVGAYRRELWIADHPAIPDGLFAMMLASDEPSSPLAPMMRSVDEALLQVKGFPLLEHAEVPYGKVKSVVERSVTGIAQRDVPEAMITPPRGYEDVTPKTPAPPAP